MRPVGHIAAVVLWVYRAVLPKKSPPDRESFRHQTSSLFEHARVLHRSIIEIESLTNAYRRTSRYQHGLWQVNIVSHFASPFLFSTPLPYLSHLIVSFHI